MKKNLLKTLCYSAALLTVLGTATATQTASANTATTPVETSTSVSPRVDPSSPEYIEVSTEAEFRDAVESDNGKTYIQLAADITLAEGSVVVPSSKASLTVDGYYETEQGVARRHRLISGLPAVPTLPGGVTDVARQKMLYVNNDNTKEVTIKDLVTNSRFIAGVVEVNNSRDEVTVNFENTDINGPMGAKNNNGWVNFYGEIRGVLNDTFTGLTHLPAKGIAEANAVNVFGEMLVMDFSGDQNATKPLFHMHASGGFSPNITVFPTGKIEMSASSSTIQTLIYSESTQTALTLREGSVVDVSTLGPVSNNQGISTLTVGTGATLNVNRKVGDLTPNTSSVGTISVANGAIIKQDANVTITNDPTSNILHVFDVASNGVLEVFNPMTFDISGVGNQSLFNFTGDGGVLSLSTTGSMSGWSVLSSQTPTHLVDEPVQAKYSVHGTDSLLISSTVDNLPSLFPMNSMRRLVLAQ